MNEELTTQLKGAITEFQVATRLLQKGYIISKPLVDTRYDYLLELKNGSLKKVQVKTCQVIDNEYIEFKTCNTHTNTQRTFNRNYKGEIDYFATFYNEKCYLVPIDECGSRSKRLRIVPPKNGQIKGVSFIFDYEIDKILPND